MYLQGDQYILVQYSCESRFPVPIFEISARRLLPPLTQCFCCLPLVVNMYAPCSVAARVFLLRQKKSKFTGTRFLCLFIFGCLHSLVRTWLPPLLNIIRRFTWNSKKCIFLSSIFLTYKKKLKHIMQDLHGKWLNSAVNLSEMLQTGCCLFYEYEYEFLWAQKTFYCMPTPALEPLMLCVCFLHKLLLKKINKKINLRSRLCLKCHRSSLCRQVAFIRMHGSFSSWTINHVSRWACEGGWGGDEMIIHKRQTFIAC